jgi:phosphoribosylaminoimidazole (AIR) synthetase
VGFRIYPENAAGMEAVAAVLHMTGGNFCLLHRFLAQIERIAQISVLRMITKEVVEIVYQQLVIGSNEATWMTVIAMEIWSLIVVIYGSV